MGFLFLILLASFKAEAQGKPRKYSHPLYAEAVVDVPLFIAAGGGYSFNEHIQTDLVYGIMPDAFSTLIGQVASSAAGNDNYQSLVEDALQNNSLLRLSGTYNLDTRISGWHFTVAGIILNSSGDSDANRISRAFGGQHDYSTLLALLIASGRNTTVHMDSTLQIFEAQVAYSWKIQEYLILDFTGGFIKVINSNVSLHTGINYENTPQGRDLIKASENDIESMIEEYGISPTGGVQLKYLF